MRRREFLAAGVALGGGFWATGAGGSVGLAMRNGFRGKYQSWFEVNRAGVATFERFIVAKNLLSRLEKFAGKYVEIDILHVAFGSTEGPFVLTDIASVVEVPQATTPVRMWTRRSIENPAAIDVFCSLKYLTNAVHASGYPTLGWAGYRGGDNTAHDVSGYTQRQLDFGGERHDPTRRTTPADGSTLPEEVREQGGETVTWEFSNLPAAAGEFEATVHTWIETAEGPGVFARGRLSVDIPKTGLKS